MLIMNNGLFWSLSQAKETQISYWYVKSKCYDTANVLVEDYYTAHSLILAGVDELHENQLLHVFMENIL